MLQSSSALDGMPEAGFPCLFHAPPWIPVLPVAATKLGSVPRPGAAHRLHGLDRGLLGEKHAALGSRSTWKEGETPMHWAAAWGFREAQSSRWTCEMRHGRRDLVDYLLRSCGLLSSQKL